VDNDVDFALLGTCVRDWSGATLWGAVSFVELAIVYRQSGRNNCFGGTRKRPSV